MNNWQLSIRALRMSEVKDLDRPFADVYKALDMKEQRKAMRGAMRKAAGSVRKRAAQAVGASGLGNAAAVAKGLRARVYPDRYGLGFMVSSKPYGKKGYHRNRQGKEKPVLMWAESGTKSRQTRSRSKFFIRARRGHPTGRMPRYGFMGEAESASAAQVEQSLFGQFQQNLEKRARKLGLV